MPTNDVSIALHTRLGFEFCGRVKHAGFKFGRWLDLDFYQLILDTPRATRGRLMRAHLRISALWPVCSWCCPRVDATRAEAPPSTDAAHDRRATLRETPPPVMAGVDMALQERIRASYASLTSAQRSQTSDADLGRVYGQVGKLLLAAELYDQAKPHLLNAAALDPGDLAWPYFLAHAYRLTFKSDKAIARFERRASSEARSCAGIGVARNHAHR